MSKIINQMPDWLRWLLLVPAIVCYVAASIFIMYVFLLLIGAINIYWARIIWGVIFFFFVSGFIIQIAAYIAPKGKLLVSFIFAALIFIFFVFMAINQGNIDIFSLICVSGPIAGFIAVKMNMCSKLYRKILNLKERIAAIKRTPVFWAGCILLLIAVAVGIFMYIDYRTDKTGKLFVNGKELTNVSATIRDSDAVLPFTEVLKSYGFNIIWRDSNIADITYEDKTYVFDLKENELSGEEIDYDFMALPGSTKHYSKVEGREIYVDSDTIIWIMVEMGVKVDINIDRDKLVVYVDKRID